MDMELQRAALNGYRQVLDMTFTQEETLESIVPDTYPDMARIISGSGRVFLRETETGEGTVRLSGTIQTTVLYIPEGEDLPRALDVSIPFQCTKDHPQIHSSSIVRGAAWSVFADARAVNPRKVVVRAEVVLQATVYEQEHKELTQDISCRESDCLEKRQIQFRETAIVSVQEKPFLFSDVIRPSSSRGDMEEILLCRTELAPSEAKFIGQKLVVKGCVQLHVVYRSGASLMSACFEIPYSQVLDVEGEGESNGSEVDVILRSVDCRLRDGALEVTVEAAAQVILRIQRPVTLLSDAYCVSCRLDTERTPCQLCSMAERNCRREAGRHFCQTGIQAGQVLDCCLAVKEVAEREGEHGRELTAQLAVHLLYISEDNALCSISDSIVAVCGADLPDGCHRRFRCRPVGEVTAVPVTGGIELRYELEFCWTTVEEKTILCVSSVKKGAPYTGECSRPSLVIRRVDQGEELWDIAKACGSTIQDICVANELPTEAVSQGTLLLIPTKRG